MIKGETITHEGNPGPNWLDHCRNIVSPGKVTAFIIAGAIVACALVIYDRSQTPSVTGTANTQATPKESQQTQLAPSDSLQVEQLEKSLPSPEQQSTSSLQPSGTTAPSKPSAVGPAPTTALQSQSTAKSSSGRSSTSPTLQSVHQSVQETRTNVRNALNGLGL